METANVILRRLFRCLFTYFGLDSALFCVACFSFGFAWFCLVVQWFAVAFGFAWFFRLLLFFHCFVEASNKQKGVDNFCI